MYRWMFFVTCYIRSTVSSHRYLNCTSYNCNYTNPTTNTPDNNTVINDTHFNNNETIKNETMTFVQKSIEKYTEMNISADKKSLDGNSGKQPLMIIQRDKILEKRIPKTPVEEYADIPPEILFKNYVKWMKIGAKCLGNISKFISYAFQPSEWLDRTSREQHLPTLDELCLRNAINALENMHTFKKEQINDDQIESLVENNEYWNIPQESKKEFKTIFSSNGTIMRKLSNPSAENFIDDDNDASKPFTIEDFYLKQINPLQDLFKNKICESIRPSVKKLEMIFDPIHKSYYINQLIQNVRTLIWDAISKRGENEITRNEMIDVITEIGLQKQIPVISGENNFEIIQRFHLYIGDLDSLYQGDSLIWYLDCVNIGVFWIKASKPKEYPFYQSSDQYDCFFGLNRLNMDLMFFCEKEIIYREFLKLWNAEEHDLCQYSKNIAAQISQYFAALFCLSADYLDDGLEESTYSSKFSMLIKEFKCFLTDSRITDKLVHSMRIEDWIHKYLQELYYMKKEDVIVPEFNSDFCQLLVPKYMHHVSEIIANSSCSMKNISLLTSFKIAFLYHVYIFFVQNVGV